MTTISDKIRLTLEKVRLNKGRVCVLTGAGISAESGIRTFRGKDGYWTVGSEAYTPQEMATLRMFRHSPEESWRWYLTRFLKCRNAEPNAGHYALVDLEKNLGDRFSLVTQNIDALHVCAGSSEERCHQIHGSIKFMRCSQECSQVLIPLPKEIEVVEINGNFQPLRELLSCPDCGSLTRPHVLWFDECYNEIYCRVDSALKAAAQADLLIVAGTTLETTVPFEICQNFDRMDKPIICIDIEEGRASQFARYSQGGGFIQMASSIALPEICHGLL